LNSKDEKSNTQWLLLRQADTARKQGFRTIIVCTIPHPSPMFHSMVPIVCLLSAYLANSMIVDLDCRSGPPRPANLNE